MKTYFFLFLAGFFSFSSMHASDTPLTQDMQKILDQPKYVHSIWGIYVKDLHTGNILYDVNSNKLFSPASTTKLFSVAALLHALGDEYRFKTPVYYSGNIENNIINGNLILVAQGDLTMGGRQPNPNTIAYTKMDHIIANSIPGAILTKEDPLHGMNELAKQISEKGIKEINGEVFIDDSLFDITQKRDMIISPIMINENLIDIVINPTNSGQKANVSWRPQVPGYTLDNQVKTVDNNGKLELQVTADDSGQHIVIHGTIPLNQHDIVRTSAIKEPKEFARAAFVQALAKNGIKVNIPEVKTQQIVTLQSVNNPQQIAVYTSPPLSEYAKLILKVSHNLGADLIPLLLAAQKGKKSFNDGMRLIGEFVMQEIKLSPDSFVFIDAAGGNENRLTPQAEIQLLEYMHKLSPSQFQHFFDALPILGVDGSLEDFAKKTDAVGKVRAKPGTGVALNLATEKFFLITQGYAGYVEGKNGHLYAYIVIVNNATMPAIDDIFAIFEDEGQLSSMIYNQTSNAK